MKPSESLPRTTPDSPESRFEAIPTDKELLARAGAESVNTANQARGVLALRYRKAIRAYLGRLLQNDADADEAAQDVIVKILKGNFGGVDLARGRFRNYLKVAVRNTAFAFLRRRGKVASGADVTLLAADDAAVAMFEQNWARDFGVFLLDQAWEGLRVYEAAHPGNVFGTVLQLVLDHPEDSSEQIAVRLAAATGRPFQAANVRQQLHRARSKFAELIVEEVRRTLDDATPERVAEELVESGLQVYVRDFMPTAR